MSLQLSLSPEAQQASQASPLMRNMVIILKVVLEAPTRL